MEFSAVWCLAAITLLNFLQQATQVGAKRDPHLYCGGVPLSIVEWVQRDMECYGPDDITYTCSALIDEIHYAISQEDPRRTIDVGSFRIDPNGQRKHETIPYAGSEAHLHELVENICDKMTDYGIQTIPDTGTISYVRFQPRGDEPVELEHVSYSEEIGKRLKKACNDILEDYEDDIITHFKAKTVNIHEELCENIIGYCRQNKDEL